MPCILLVRTLHIHHMENQGHAWLSIKLLQTHDTVPGACCHACLSSAAVQAFDNRACDTSGTGLGAGTDAAQLLCGCPIREGSPVLQLCLLGEHKVVAKRPGQGYCLLNGQR